MTNILITGSSGFIGTQLISNLLSTNSNVNIYALTRNKNYNNKKNLTYIYCDLTQTNFIEVLPQNIDIVLHLAQSNNYRLFPDKVFDIFDINIVSTQRLLEWSRVSLVKKFIFTSSGNVYSRKDDLLSETDVCLPNDYYGKSKLIAELLIESYQQYFSTCILRIFGVYGPGQSGMTIPNIINKVMNNESITLAKGKGLFFTPLYISDCIRMIQIIINDSLINKFQIYNLAGSEIISLDQLVFIIATNTSINPKTENTNEEPAKLMGSSKKFVNNFKFNFSTDFESGMYKALSHLNQTN